MRFLRFRIVYVTLYSNYSIVINFCTMNNVKIKTLVEVH